LWASVKDSHGEVQERKKKMMSHVLAFFAPGPLGLVIIILMMMAIPVVLIIVVVVYVSRGSKERQRLRQQMDDLTRELKQTQEQLKGRGPFQPDSGHPTANSEQRTA
jgi:uncharacterized membrane protein